MQSAKKLVLVDEFDREYKRLQRPGDAVVKTGQSLQLSDTLRDQSIADDKKVRQYVSALHRYLNLRKEVPAEPELEPNFGTPSQTPVRRQLQQRRRRGRGRRHHQSWAPY